MRKYLFIIIFLVSFSKVSAQTILLERPEIYIGVSQGGTGSMLLFNPTVKQDMLFGYNGGLIFRYVSEKQRALQIELNYSQRGWEEKENLYSRRLSYVEMPFLMHLYWGNKARFFFNLGPKVSFLLSENVLYNNTENSTKEQHTHDAKNSFDYGVTLGIGLEFAFKKQHFSLEVRPNYSFSTVFSNNKSHAYSFSNNMNLAVNLAWLMQVSK